jgi:hypothetical protein
MRPGSILISILSLGIAFFGVIWLGRGDIEVKEIPRAPVRTGLEREDLPRPAKQGPHPRAIVDNTKHDFGIMQRGESGEHEYKFTNEGDAPLQIAVGSKTCQCTVGDLEGIATIAPGESTMVKLKWTIKNPSPRFQHSAEIHTNDPKDEQITLMISGIIGTDLVRIPSDDWSMGTFGREEDARMVGYVFSETQDFKVTKVECSSKLFKVEYARVADDDLDEFNSQRHLSAPESMMPEDQLKNGNPNPVASVGPKAAWKITVSAVAKIPVGSLRVSMSVHTDIEAKRVSNFDLTAKKEGPIKVVPIPRKGMRYFSERMLVDVGEFNAKDGLEIKMMLIISQVLEEKLKVTAKCDPKWLECEVKEAKINKASSRHELTIRIPPGSPRIVRTTSNPATIVLTTNCPFAEEIPIRLAFVAQ